MIRHASARGSARGSARVKPAPLRGAHGVHGLSSAHARAQKKNTKTRAQLSHTHTTPCTPCTPCVPVRVPVRLPVRWRALPVRSHRARVFHLTRLPEKIKRKEGEANVVESRAAFARRLGVHRSFVTRAAQAGRLVLEGNKINVEASLARLKDTEGGRTDVAARHAAQRGAELPAAPAQRAQAPQAPDEAPEAAGRARYKAMALHYENQQIKLDMALARGLRFQRASVAREALNLGSMLRSHVERVIDQTAPRLAVLTDPAARANMTRAELLTVRRAIRVELTRALRRLRTQTRGEK